MENIQKISLWKSIGRAVIGKCPNCGKGSLFKSYIKPVDSCSVCGERFDHIKADDGPAWLTIVIVGHILAPFILAFGMDSRWPDWVSMVVWTLSALFLMVPILPRSKGFFIAIIWRMKISETEKL